MLWFKRFYFKISGQDAEHVEIRIEAPDQDFTSLFTAVTWNRVGGSAPSFNYSYDKHHGLNTGVISGPPCGAIYNYKFTFTGLFFPTLNTYKR